MSLSTPISNGGAEASFAPAGRGNLENTTFLVRVWHKTTIFALSKIKNNIHLTSRAVTKGGHSTLNAWQTKKLFSRWPG